MSIFESHFMFSFIVRSCRCIALTVSHGLNGRSPRRSMPIDRTMISRRGDWSAQSFDSANCPRTIRSADAYIYTLQYTYVFVNDSANSW